MQKSLINPEDTSKPLSTRMMEVLGGSVEADAWCCWQNMRAFNLGHHWWGSTIRSNSCWTQVVQYIASTGAAISVIGRYIPIPIHTLVSVVGGAIFGFISHMAFTAGQVARNCRNGGWVTINLRYFYPRHWHNC